MLKNYLIVAMRNLLRYRTFSLINISGLAIGMACCILMLLLIEDELKYDRYHENADRIYRVLARVGSEEGNQNATTPAPLGPALMDDFPEIAAVVRLAQEKKVSLGYGERRFYERRFFYADPGIFRVFTMPLIQGNPETALEGLSSVVISEEMAEKYFGDENPLGKSLEVAGTAGGTAFTVTGVFEKIPDHSHLQFDFLCPLKVLYSSWNLDNPMNFMYSTYLLLSETTDPALLQQRFPEFVARHYGAMLGEHGLGMELALQPLKDIHLYSHVRYGIRSGGDVRYLYAYGAIAAILLLIACINFTNLSTARSARRAREVGIRKVVGADRRRLLAQFLGESVVLSFIALLMAIALVEISLPAFSRFVGKDLDLAYSGTTLTGMIGIGLLAGVVAGSYPAFFLSTLEPVTVLKGGTETAPRRARLRKVLVVTQFAISIALLVSTGVVFEQMRYIRARELGFNKEHVVVLPLTEQRMREHAETIKGELLRHPRIVGATGSSDLPGAVGHGWLFRPVDPPGDEQGVPTMLVDYDFIGTMEIPLLRGRAFSRSMEMNAGRAFIVNETAARTFGWDVGRKLVNCGVRGHPEGTVIGVVRDFHFASLHTRIQPMLLLVQGWPSYLCVRVQAEDLPATLAFIRERWREFEPKQPFEYTFLDEDFDRFYRTEERLGKTFGCFALLTILIACLGLFGLASFTAEQRTKEIGIRKVLGASAPGIVALLSKEFTALVIVANVIAWPVGYLVMRRWLEGFAYRIDLGPGIFALAGLLALGIAWLTVSWQAIRAALANPVEALRYE